MKNWAMLLCVACMLGVSTPLFAQQAQQGDAFSLLFPKPSGKNGYEEWIMAGMIINRNEEAKKVFTNPNPSLSDIRRVFQMPEIRQAKVLFLAGLNKRISLPHNAPDLDSLYGPTPELAPLRSCARLHAKEIYLALAEGRNHDALEALRAGLQFGHQIQMQTLLSGMIGIGMDAIVLRTLDGNLETLSVQDCEALQRLVEEWLLWDSPVASLIASERQWIQRAVQKVKNDPNSLLNSIDTINAEDSTPEEVRLQRDIQNSVGRMSEIMSETGALIESYFQEILQNLKLPPYKRKATPRIPKTTLAGRVAYTFLIAGDRVAYRYDRERANIQMLGVRAALRRYHWERMRYPARLSELRLGELAIDPFTGKPFTYRLEGDAYTLKAEDPTESM